jgi:hypothetical protein
MVTTKTKYKYQCSSCNTTHVKESQYCHYCKKYNTIVGTEIEAKKYSIPRQSLKLKQKVLDSKGLIDREKEEQEKWFNDTRVKMVGVCQFCGGKTEKNNDKTFKRSIAHLLPKRKNQFPSIATHEDNWLELCFFSNSCHTNFDNGIIEWDVLEEQPIWDVIKEKFTRIYPYIKETEKRNIPKALNQIIK